MTLTNHPHVVVDERGEPMVRETRVSVRTLYMLHRAGIAFATIAQRYPQVPRAKILDALSYAYAFEA